MPVMYVFITGALYHEGACDAIAKLPIKLDGLKALDGAGFGIAIDEAAGTAILVLLDVPVEDRIDASRVNCVSLSIDLGG